MATPSSPVAEPAPPAPNAPEVPAPSMGMEPPMAPPGPPPKRGLSRGALVGIVVVVVVVVVILALLLSGAIPGFKLGSSSSSSSGPATTSFRSALMTANSSAAGLGGTWTVIAALGVDSVTALGVPADLASTLGVSCPVTHQAASPPSLPAYTGSYVTGDQTGWVFFLFQDSSSTLLLSLVIGSTATTLGTIVGSSCFTDFSYFTGAVGVIDSPSVTAAVATDASSFTAQLSQASSTLFFISGASITEGTTTITTGAAWNVMYTNCSLSTESGSGLEYTATVNATSGTVTTNGGTQAIACNNLSIQPPKTQPSTTPLGSVFAMGNPFLTTGTSATNNIGCLTGDYCYTLTVEQASGVTFANLGLEVRTASDAPYSGAVSISIVSIESSGSASTLPATCAGAECNGGGSSPGWTYGTTGPCASAACGPTAFVTSVMSITFDMGTTNPTGLGFEAVGLGEGPFSGTVSVILP